MVRPARYAGSIAAGLIDPWVIDGVLVRLLPSVFVRGGGLFLAKGQTGNVQVYATMFVIAATTARTTSSRSPSATAGLR